MLAEVNTGLLHKGLNRLTKVVKVSKTLPVLSHVLVEANGCLKITADNLDQQLTLSIPARVEKQGVVCIPAKRMARLLQWAAGETVSLSTSATSFIVHETTEKSENTLTVPAINAKEFPPAWLMTMRNEPVKVDAYQLRVALRRILPCVSRDDARPVLNAVRFEYAVGSLTLTGCDGFRVGRWTIPTSEGPENPFNSVVPLTAIDLMLQTIHMYPGETIVIDRGLQSGHGDDPVYIVFSNVTSRLATMMVPGNYPDVGVIEPKNPPVSATVSRAAMIKALNQVLVVIDGYHQPVILKIKGDALELSAENVENGSILRRMYREGEGDVDIAFNPRFLLDVLMSINEPDITIRMHNGKSPAVIRGADYKFIFMPMFIG
jgi:DNA polymerase-3 subunit beta